MKTKESPSPRLKEIVDALPLHKGLRVLEIGRGPGTAAREVAKRIGNCHILAIDRSEKAILQAIRNSQDKIIAGSLSFRQVAIEHFELEENEAPYNIAFAVRVRAVDGCHPKIEELAL